MRYETVNVHLLMCMCALFLYRGDEYLRVKKLEDAINFCAKPIYDFENCKVLMRGNKKNILAFSANIN